MGGVRFCQRRTTLAGVRPHPFYDSRQWRALRLLQLAEHPWCNYCAALGRLTPASTVDHLRPHHGRSRLFFDARNLQSLCAPCHSHLKQARERLRYQAGVGVNGRPLDRRHPWNRRRMAG